MLRHVALVRTNVLEELSPFFIRVTRIGELGTTLAVTIYWRPAWVFISQKMPFFIVTAVKTSNLMWWSLFWGFPIRKFNWEVFWLIFPEAGDERQHQCPLCGRTYKRRHHLVRHLRYECGPARKRQQCAICGKRYSRPDTLQEHYVLHHHARWVWSISLLECGRFFKSRLVMLLGLEFYVCLVRWMYFCSEFCLNAHVAANWIFTEYCLLNSGTMWIWLESMFRRNVSPLSSGFKESVSQEHVSNNCRLFPLWKWRRHVPPKCNFLNSHTVPHPRRRRSS
jgi:hypothetical protein